MSEIDISRVADLLPHSVWPTAELRHTAALEMIAPIAAILALESQNRENAMMITHSDLGGDTFSHPLDKPCKLCRPPFEVTDEMVKRAYQTWRDFPVARSERPHPAMRAALEAAING